MKDKDKGFFDPVGNNDSSCASVFCLETLHGLGFNENGTHAVGSWIWEFNYTFIIVLNIYKITVR